MRQSDRLIAREGEQIGGGVADQLDMAINENRVRPPLFGTLRQARGWLGKVKALFIAAAVAIQDVGPGISRRTTGPERMIGIEAGIPAVGVGEQNGSHRVKDVPQADISAIVVGIDLVIQSVSQMLSPEAVASLTKKVAGD